MVNPPPQLSAIRYIYLDFFVPILTRSSSFQLPLHPFQYFHLLRMSRPHHLVITPTRRLYVLSSRSHPPSTTTISSSCLQGRTPTHLLTHSLCRRHGLAITYHHSHFVQDFTDAQLDTYLEEDNDNMHRRLDKPRRISPLVSTRISCVISH